MKMKTFCAWHSKHFPKEKPPLTKEVKVDKLTLEISSDFGGMCDKCYRIEMRELKKLKMSGAMTF